MVLVNIGSGNDVWLTRRQAPLPESMLAYWTSIGPFRTIRSKLLNQIFFNVNAFENVVSADILFRQYDFVYYTTQPSNDAGSTYINTRNLSFYTSGRR